MRDRVNPLDSVKFVIDKKYLEKCGPNIDLKTLGDKWKDVAEPEKDVVELAESGLLESHDREATQRFPTVNSAPAVSLSKDSMKESELKLWRITFSIHDGGFLRIEAEKHAGCGQPVEMTFSHQDTDRIKRWLAEGDVVETHAR